MCAPILTRKLCSLQSAQRNRLFALNRRWIPPNTRGYESSSVFVYFSLTAAVNAGQAGLVQEYLFMLTLDWRLKHCTPGCLPNQHACATGSLQPISLRTPGLVFARADGARSAAEMNQSRCSKCGGCSASQDYSDLLKFSHILSSYDHKL